MREPDSSVAHVVQCSSCGAPVATIDLARPNVSCASCGASVHIPDAARAYGIAYLEAVDADRRRAQSATVQEQALENYGGTLDRSRYGSWILWSLLVGTPLVIGSAIALNAIGVGQNLVALIMAPVVGLAILVPILLMLLAKRPPRRSRSTSSAPSATAPCQNCGAPAVFELGAASATCPYCGCANLAPHDVAAPMIEWAQRQVQSAEEQRNASRSEADRALTRAQTRWESLQLLFGAMKWLSSAAIGLIFVLPLFGHPRPAERRLAVYAGEASIAWIVGVAFVAVLRGWPKKRSR